MTNTDDEKTLARGRSSEVDPPTGSPRSPQRDRSRRCRFYGVTVYDHDGAIVTIEPHMLAGREIGAREEAAIRAAIQQLRGFIGPEQ